MQVTLPKTHQVAEDQALLALPDKPPLRLLLPAATTSERPHRRLYLKVAVKYLLSLLTAGSWMGLSLWLAIPWADTLATHVTAPLAWLMIFGIALAPGFMNAFMIMSLALDQRPARKPLAAYPGITVLVAAYNEAACIADTINSLHAQRYTGPL